MNLYKLTASQLSSLLRILGALVADYIQNPKKPMSKDLAPLVRTQLQWKDLPGLNDAISVSLRGGSKLESLYSLGVELKDALPVFRMNREYTTPELQLLKALRAYLSTDSETALSYIRKNAALFRSPQLSQVFAPDIPKSDHQALRNIVKTLVGRDGKHLTLPESQVIKETNPKDYAKYVDLRKDHNAEFKAVLTNYVRASGKDKVPYQAALDYALSLGFSHSMVPGFQGLIDDQGRWYTKTGELIAGIPNLATYTHVVMNDGKDPDAQWVFKAVKPDGGAMYGYTVNFKKGQSFAKYEHVADLMANINSIRRNWLTHVKKFDITDKDSVAAVVLEILYTFAARIGSAPGRGAGTVLVKNIYPTTSGVNIAYLGKDSIPTKHMLKDSDPIQHEVAEALRLLIQGKKPSMFVFTYNVGARQVRVTPADVNRAFHEFGASAGVSCHKLRTCRGTTLFKQLMEKDELKRRNPATEKEALLRYKEMAEQVGKLLNHKRGVGSSNEKVTGVTAITSYIDASLQLDLWDRWGFRPPLMLEKLLSSGDD